MFCPLTKRYLEDVGSPTSALRICVSGFTPTPIHKPFRNPNIITNSLTKTCAMPLETILVNRNNSLFWRLLWGLFCGRWCLLKDHHPLLFYKCFAIMILNNFYCICSTKSMSRRMKYRKNQILKNLIFL